MPLLSCELVKWLATLRKVLDERRRSGTNRTNDWTLVISLGRPISDHGYFDRIHLYATFRQDEAEILYRGLSKRAFLALR